MFTGKYMYIDGRRQSPGDRALMTSPLQSPTLSSCVLFYYYMKGTGVGTLNVLLRRGGVEEGGRMVAKVQGEQGAVWRRVMVHVVEVQYKWKVRGAMFVLQIHAFFFIRKLVVLLVQDFLKNSNNF